LANKEKNSPMKKSLACAALVLSAITIATLEAQADPSAPVIDNGRVTVRDILLKQGEQATAIEHPGDYVVLYVTGGRIRHGDGSNQDIVAGSAIAGHGGVTRDTAVSGNAHEVVVELKDTPSNTVANTTGLPPGFPRPGAKKVFENGKVRVWNYTWLPGKPTPMHFHDTEVVVVYLGDGDIAATTPDGKRTITHHNPGDIVFNLANRSHSEELVQGDMSGIMLELK
jgi:quercetin dioxygenase-like cupin family protein